MKLLDVLGLIFITLKLCNIIAWSWFWVLLPFIIPFSIIIILGFIEGIREGFNKRR